MAAFRIDRGSAGDIPATGHAVVLGECLEDAAQAAVRIASSMVASVGAVPRAGSAESSAIDDVLRELAQEP